MVSAPCCGTTSISPSALTKARCIDERWHQHQVRGHAGLRVGVAVDDDGAQAVDEVARLVGRDRAPGASASGRAAHGHAHRRAGLPGACG
jgi:hypothetical protein